MRTYSPRLPSLFAALALAIAPLASSSIADAQAAPAAAPAPQLTPLPADQVTGIVAKVQQFYDQTTNFQADFAQEYDVKQYNKKKFSKGHVVFDKPGKMNWTYADPAGNRVVSDGKKVRIYEADSKQLYEQDVNANQYPAALSFLTGQGKLADAFDFTGFDGAQMNFPGGWVLIGVPKQANPAFQKVLFYVDKPTNQVRRVLVVDGQGNHNKFDFIHPTINQKLPPGEFVFTPPPGTTTIRP